jgi:hypothetical protein
MDLDGVLLCGCGITYVCLERTIQRWHMIFNSVKCTLWRACRSTLKKEKWEGTDSLTYSTSLFINIITYKNQNTGALFENRCTNACWLDKPSHECCRDEKQRQFQPIHKGKSLFCTRRKQVLGWHPSHFEPTFHSHSISSSSPSNCIPWEMMSQEMAMTHTPLYHGCPMGRLSAIINVQS